ncbi:unnamed protein product [Rotaria sp. Silwood1]|nr:unnamed protein product [Rotaria sp. Silwood1]
MRLFSQRHLSSSLSIDYHSYNKHTIRPIIPVAIIRNITKTSMTTTIDFPKARCPVNKRQFTSPAVESLIEEIQKNIKNKELAWLFENCFPNTLDTTVDFDEKAASEKKPDTYVITGDIDAMWLRDSSAQINLYLPLMNQDKKLRQLIEGVLLRQCIFIQRDPYANAHYKDTNRISEWKHMDKTEMRAGVHERKWELDSLCYVLRLMHSYWKEVNYDLSFFRENEQDFKKTIRIILQTMKEQQRFNESGSSQILRSCVRDCRNKPLPIRLKIEYINQGLTIYINNGISQDDNAFEFCTHIDHIQLPKVGYLGVTAATGGLADDHDVLELLTHTYFDRQVLTDLQQKVNNLQTNLKNPQVVGTGNQVVGSNVDANILNELRDTIRQIKSETNTLLHKSSNQIQCPTVGSVGDSSCLGPYTFFAIIALQIVIFIGYFTYRKQQDYFPRKYL